MAERFGRVAILGLGLIGGSLGLALRARDLAETVAGFDPLAGRAGRARERGAITETAASPEEAVRGAELAVLAAPVGAIPALLAAIAPALDPAALVTDTGSVKRPICDAAAGRTPYDLRPPDGSGRPPDGSGRTPDAQSGRPPDAPTLPNPARFVGGHPMTGREQSGIEAAEPALFEGAVWCLTPDRATDGGALARVEALVRALGATPRRMDADWHDMLVGGISHLPLAAAAALVATVAADPAGPEALELAAGGYRDTTRVASGDTIMARDILLANADNIAAWLGSYIAELTRLRALIVAGDADGIERRLGSAKDAREEWLARRTSADSPHTS